MNELTQTTELLEDPLFLVLLAVSLSLVLVVLYQGGLWRYVTGAVIGLANLCVGLLSLYTGLMTCILLGQAVFGSPAQRVASFTWAIVLAAFTFVLPLTCYYFNTTDTRVGRWVTGLKPEEYRDTD